MLNNITTLNVHELKQKWDENPSLILIDVRETSEWQETNIPGAIHIPKDEICTRIKDLIKDTNAPIYLHCRSGARSLHAAESLQQLGFQQVFSIDGGIIEWEKSGYKVNKLLSAKSNPLG